MERKSSTPGKDKRVVPITLFWPFIANSDSHFIRKVSFCHRPRWPLVKVEVQLYSIFDLCTRRGWGASVTLRPHITPAKTRYPLYRSLGGPQGRSGQVRKISSPPGFDPRTVQPVGSRYTYYATRPSASSLYTRYIFWISCGSNINTIIHLRLIK